MTLASAALGLVLPSKEDTNKDASPSPLHLIVPVDYHKGSGDEGYYPCKALVDSGATYNFISQFIVDILRLEAVMTGRSNVKIKASPPITTVNSELLRATVVVWSMVWMSDSARTQ